MTGTCLPIDTQVTFVVPQGGSLVNDGGGGEGIRTATTNGAGVATVRFTYTNRNGDVGSTSYPLAVSTDPNALVDPCPPTSCAQATFLER